MTDNTINNNTINNIVIYQSESGAIALRSDHDVETLKQSLITQGQATPLFRPKTESRYFHKIPTCVGMTTPDLNERNPVIPSQDGISSYLLDTVSGTA